MLLLSKKSNKSVKLTSVQRDSESLCPSIILFCFTKFSNKQLKLVLFESKGFLKEFEQSNNYYYL